MRCSVLTSIIGRSSADGPASALCSSREDKEPKKSLDLPKNWRREGIAPHNLTDRLAFTGINH